MAATRLKEAFLHLSQHSVDSVQNGNAFTNWDEYMHVDRPIESKLMEKMDEIDKAGGGIVLLIGSAGDGKSHLISRIKQMSDWGDSSFYNDATASSSPKKTAIDTLKVALVDFKDVNLYNTNKKLVLAINLGKLNALIDDNEFRSDYHEIVNSTLPIFDDDDTTPPINTERVKVIMFTDEQIFEFFADSSSDIPVDSIFLSKIMEKVVIVLRFQLPQERGRPPLHRGDRFDGRRCREDFGQHPIGGHRRSHQIVLAFLISRLPSTRVSGRKSIA